MYSQNTLIRIEIKQQQKINKKNEDEEEIFLFEIKTIYFTIHSK